MKKAKKEKAEETVVKINLVPDEHLEPRRIYSNFVSVSTTPMDFSLKFCDATPIAEIEDLDREINHRVPIVAEIVIPFHLMPKLIKTLQSQLKIYNTQIQGDKNEGKARKK